MSEPKRYEAMGPEVIATPTGEFVRYEDYARLKAEVERLTAFTTRTIIPNEELQAQVDRLTKAGDAMASSIQFNEEMAQDYNGPAIVHQSVQRWHAAKEGKPSV